MSSVELYKLRPFPQEAVDVEAMQLWPDDFETTKNLAAWCGGQANWGYDGVNEDTQLTIVIDCSEQRLPNIIVYPNDWVIKHRNGTFSKLTNSEFQQSLFSAEGIKHFKPPPTCQYCLSDPRFTGMADVGEKACPICSARYSGPARTYEYEVLVQAGMVNLEE